MNEIIDNILDRPTSHKAIIWLISVAVILGVSWQYLLKGAFEEQSKLKEEIESIETQIHEQELVARKLPEFKKIVEGLDAKLETTLLELPDKKEIDNLLESISVLAIDTGLEVMKFTPARDKLQDFFAEVPVLVELEGTYHQLATFFDEVGHLPRIVNIGNVTIDILTEAKQEVLIRATCLVTTFRYLDESERMSKKSKKGKSRKKGKKKRTV